MFTEELDNFGSGFRAAPPPPHENIGTVHGFNDLSRQMGLHGEEGRLLHQPLPQPQADQQGTQQFTQENK